MADNLYPAASHELNQARQALVPETNGAFAAFSKSVFKEGALDAPLPSPITALFMIVAPRARVF